MSLWLPCNKGVRTILGQGNSTFELITLTESNLENRWSESFATNPPWSTKEDRFLNSCVSLIPFPPLQPPLNSFVVWWPYWKSFIPRVLFQSWTDIPAHPLIGTQSSSLFCIWSGCVSVYICKRTSKGDPDGQDALLHICYLDMHSQVLMSYYLLEVLAGLVNILLWSWSCHHRKVVPMWMNDVL